jgi:hypothetical protein
MRDLPRTLIRALKLVSANLARTVPLNNFASLTDAELASGTMSKQLGCGMGDAVGVGVGSGVAVVVGVRIGVAVVVSVGVVVGVGSRPGWRADAGLLAVASTAINAIITANAINGRTIASLSCARFFG